jgi:hypothetical protein
MDKGIMADEIKLYGAEEDDEMVPDCTENCFDDLENVIAKVRYQQWHLSFWDVYSNASYVANGVSIFE